MGEDAPDASLDGRCHGWIVNDQPVGNCVEVIECFVGVDDDFHLPRNFANTASTWLSLAKRPSAAARRPRSIPASSSGVGSYSPSLNPASSSSANSASSFWTWGGHASTRSRASFNFFVFIAAKVSQKLTAFELKVKAVTASGQ